ncbi:hypothetical protein F2Q68_00046688 [Brassica cretica]|uniref:J domain-containing protein n=1 Tax=Brassica cretica TaxID=69181 RepID=A0A8S9LF86_BRACR|nr:hypothetical protein F2Q68_00046688 [Brassica cretica]
MDTNQAPGIDDLKKVADNPSGDSMFDASQYAFFGNDVVEEVELGGLEEEEDEILSFNGIREGFSFDKEEVEDSRPLSDVDDLATTFSKLNRDPEVYRNTGPIIDRRPGQNSLAPDWTYREELPDWNGQKLLDSDAIKDDKAWSGQPFSTLDPKRTTPHLEPQRQLHQNHNQQQFPSDPILVPKSSFGSYPPPSSILPDQCSGHPNVAPYHSGGAQMGSPNFSQFPTLQPQLAGMHHGSPQRAGNVPQFRPDLPLNNRPQAQWMNNALLQQPEKPQPEEPKKCEETVIEEDYPGEFEYPSVPVEEEEEKTERKVHENKSSAEPTAPTTTVVNTVKEIASVKVVKVDTSSSADEMKRILKSLNHYEALGFSRHKKIDDAVLKKEYRKKAMLVHPDKNMGSPLASESFKKLQCAYEVLSDIVKKRDYDEQLRKEESRTRSVCQTSHASSHQSGAGYRAEESRRIHCTKCGNSHIWVCTSRTKAKARWCQDCGQYHQAKDGDGWVELKGTLPFERAHKIEIPRAFVCAESKIFDVSEWAICQGMACRPNTHRPSFHVNMVGLEKTTQRSNSSRFPWDLDVEMMDEDEEEFELWLQQALASGLFCETSKRRKSWSPFKDQGSPLDDNATSSRRTRETGLGGCKTEEEEKTERKVHENKSSAEPTAPTTTVVNTVKEIASVKVVKVDTSSSADEMKRILKSLNHYEALGFSRHKKIDDAVLKKEYRKKAMLVHPDKNMGSPLASESFKKLQCAYEVLSDIVKKRDYDEQLRKEESKTRSVCQTSHASSHQSGAGYRAEESRRIHCTKCGNSHIWVCTSRTKAKARWCQDCGQYHQAKDGDGWVELKGTLPFERAHKIEIPRAFVCAESKIFDVSEWAICQGMACRPNTHRPSFHVNMVGLEKTTHRSNSSRFPWDLDVEMMDEDEEEFELWLQQALASGLFCETSKRRKSWSPFKLSQMKSKKQWRRTST